VRIKITKNKFIWRLTPRTAFKLRSRINSKYIFKIGDLIVTRRTRRPNYYCISCAIHLFIIDPEDLEKIKTMEE